MALTYRAPRGPGADIKIPHFDTQFYWRWLNKFGGAGTPQWVKNMHTIASQRIVGDIGRAYAFARTEIKVTKDELLLLMAAQESRLNDGYREGIRRLPPPSGPPSVSVKIDPAVNGASPTIFAPVLRKAVTLDSTTGLARLATFGDDAAGLAAAVSGSQVTLALAGDRVTGFTALVPGTVFYVGKDGSPVRLSQALQSYVPGQGGIKRIGRAITSSTIEVLDSTLFDPYTLSGAGDVIPAQAYLSILGTNTAGGSLSTYVPVTGDPLYVPLGTGILNVANSSTSATAVLAGVVVGPLPGAPAWTVNANGQMAGTAGMGFVMAQPGDLVLPGVFGSQTYLNGLGAFRKLYVASSSAPSPLVVAPAGGQYLSEVVQSPKRFSDLVAADMLIPWRVGSTTLPATSGE